jgi:diaminopimelate epimerase
MNEGWESVDYINTGVPHVVVRVQNLSNHPVVEQGRVIRYHTLFAPEGTNANFAKMTGPHQMEIRTYERGVEDETLACGTGAIASSLVGALRGMVSSPVHVKTRGGEELTICFEKKADSFDKVYLEGNTSIVYQGHLHEEALL